MMVVQHGAVLSTGGVVIPPTAMVGAWKSDLLDMMGHPGGRDRCVYTHLCFPCAAGDVARRTGGSYFTDCAIGGTLGMWYFFSGCIWGPTRTRLRLMHGIAGSVIDDFCLTSLLPCCYLSQALNHLDIVDAQRGVQATGAPK